MRKWPLLVSESLDALLARNDKAYVQRNMMAGLTAIVLQMYDEGRIDGVISVGGGQGTAIATSAMKELPVGIPKVMVSTVASGESYFWSVMLEQKTLP